MKIQVKLLAHLKGYLQDSEKNKEWLSLNVEENASIKEVIASLGIPSYIPKIAFINDTKGNLDDIPKEGDRVTVCALSQGG